MSNTIIQNGGNKLMIDNYKIYQSLKDYIELPDFDEKNRLIVSALSAELAYKDLKITILDISNDNKLIMDKVFNQVVHESAYPEIIYKWSNSEKALLDEITIQTIQEKIIKHLQGGAAAFDKRSSISEELKIEEPSNIGKVQYYLLAYKNFNPIKYVLAVRGTYMDDKDASIANWCINIQLALANSIKLYKLHGESILDKLVEYLIGIIKSSLNDVSEIVPFLKNPITFDVVDFFMKNAPLDQAIFNYIRQLNRNKIDRLTEENRINKIYNDDRERVIIEYKKEINDTIIKLKNDDEIINSKITPDKIHIKVVEALKQIQIKYRANYKIDLDLISFIPYKGSGFFSSGKQEISSISEITEFKAILDKEIKNFFDTKYVKKEIVIIKMDYFEYINTLYSAVQLCIGIQSFKIKSKCSLLDILLNILQKKKDKIVIQLEEILKEIIISKINNPESLKKKITEFIVSIIMESLSYFKKYFYTSTKNNKEDEGEEEDKDDEDDNLKGGANVLKETLVEFQNIFDMLKREMSGYDLAIISVIAARFALYYGKKDYLGMLKTIIDCIEQINTKLKNDFISEFVKKYNAYQQEMAQQHIRQTEKIQKREMIKIFFIIIQVSIKHFLFEHYFKHSVEEICKNLLVYIHTNYLEDTKKYAKNVLDSCQKIVGENNLIIAGHSLAGGITQYLGSLNPANYAYAFNAVGMKICTIDDSQLKDYMILPPINTVAEFNKYLLPNIEKPIQEDAAAASVIQRDSDRVKTFVLYEDIVHKIRLAKTYHNVHYGNVYLVCDDDPRRPKFVNDMYNLDNTKDNLGSQGKNVLITHGITQLMKSLINIIKWTDNPQDTKINYITKPFTGVAKTEGSLNIYPNEKNYEISEIEPKNKLELLPKYMISKPANTITFGIFKNSYSYWQEGTQNYENIINLYNYLYINFIPILDDLHKISDHTGLYKWFTGSKQSKYIKYKTKYLKLKNMFDNGRLQ